jgi:tetratricopeptide (TPR) repeat protein
MRTRAAVVVALALAAWAAPSTLDAQQPLAEQEQPADASPLERLRRGRDAFIGARDFSSALPPAQEIVAAQSQQREQQYPADLAALGLIQAELREIDDAIGNLVDAIALVADEEGEYSPTLIEYYRALGRIYTKNAQYQQAIVTLEQAQHITQRHLGLFNVEQAALLDDITTAYLGLGNTVDAQKMQVERLDNAVRRFGPTDPRVIPFRYTLARYYERSRLPESAREQYEEVLNAQEVRLGAADAELLAPLRELVSLDLLVTQGVDPTRRDRLAAVLEQNVEAAPVERGLTLALLGDWAIVTGEAQQAADYYRQAWTALEANPDVDVAAFFSKPAMIDFVPPLSPVDRNERSRPYTWAEIALEFDVSPAGLPSDVKVVSRDPNLASLHSRYVRRMRETHFRPRLVGGEPVATSEVRWTNYVRRYIDKDEEEAAEQ